ncbi:MAG TPA: RloB family protein [Puia sp.]|nr:RloB family protein [Puia sp.]
MPDAWDLVPDTERKPDSFTTFILFCEDEVNEPSYFRSFEIPGKVKVNAIEDQLSRFKNISNTLHYCETTGLLDHTDGRYQLKPGTTTHVWSVFDRDVEVADIANLNPRDNLDFSLSIQSALSAGLQVAWSNDVFELWILLHFEDVDPGVWRHRTYIYDKLTEIFKNLPNQPAEMVAVTGRDDFHYKFFLKKKRYFVAFVLPYLAARNQLAIERAKGLEAAFTAGQRYHECNPCTKVHHLVQSLMSFAE